MEVTLIGAGNVATNLGKALLKAGHKVVAIVSRTQESADALATILHCQAFTIVDYVKEQEYKYNGRPIKDASEDRLATKCNGRPIKGAPGDKTATECGCEPTKGRKSPLSTEGMPEGQRGSVYIISIKDDAIDALAARLLPLAPDAVWVHTAGSVPMSLLEGKGAKRVGVFYPMQTFSKDKEVDFSKISIFIESNTCKDTLHELASSLTPHVYELTSEQRKHLHLAAVFACNFVNHCYALSEEVLKEIHIPFSVMLPLIDETADKVHTLAPRDAQTGPAIRHDTTVMQRQHDLLDGRPDLQQIYDLLSKSIDKGKPKCH